MTNAQKKHWINLSKTNTFRTAAGSIVAGVILLLLTPAYGEAINLIAIGLVGIFGRNAVLKNGK